MSVLKSVIITLPKGLSKAPGVFSATELPKTVQKFNFGTTVLINKSRMDPKRIAKHEELHDESELFKTDVCLRGKKRRLDHLTWEEKLQRKYVGLRRNDAIGVYFNVGTMSYIYTFFFSGN